MNSETLKGIANITTPRGNPSTPLEAFWVSKSLPSCPGPAPGLQKNDPKNQMVTTNGANTRTRQKSAKSRANNYDKM